MDSTPQPPPPRPQPIFSLSLLSLSRRLSVSRSRSFLPASAASKSRVLHHQPPRSSGFQARLLWSPATSESTATASSDFQPPTTPSSRNRRPSSSQDCWICSWVSSWNNLTPLKNLVIWNQALVSVSMWTSAWVALYCLLLVSLGTLYHVLIFLLKEYLQYQWTCINMV
ncbi:hypothetical protein PIB30_073823 [Stylosanthes scabra]|uniref:Uncharacterized protein n=1 Tax=Stylosanthes scabra TaxID=79078 RepID=A0ABU6ZN41_9FABA|nr:hypothetical protein [Stylosanthes scabra]